MSRERAGNIALAILLVLALALLLQACAAAPRPPECERWQALPLENEKGEAFLLVDLPNVLRLKALITGLAEGTCRLPLEPGEAEI